MLVFLPGRSEKNRRTSAIYSPAPCKILSFEVSGFSCKPRLLRMQEATSLGLKNSPAIPEVLMASETILSIMASFVLAQEALLPYHLHDMFLPRVQKAFPPNPLHHIDNLACLFVASQSLSICNFCFSL